MTNHLASHAATDVGVFASGDGNFVVEIHVLILFRKSYASYSVCKTQSGLFPWNRTYVFDVVHYVFCGL